MINRILIILIFTAALTYESNSQVKIGPAAGILHQGAVLDVESSNRGFLPPRIALTGSMMLLNNATPPDGTMIYNTNTNLDTGLTGEGIYIWRGNRWNMLTDVQLQAIELADKAVTPVKIASGTSGQVLTTNGSGSDSQWTSGLSNRLTVSSNTTLTNLTLPIGGSLVLVFTAPYTVTSMAGASFVPITSANTWELSTATTLKAPQGTYLLTRNSASTIDIVAAPSYSSIDYNEVGVYEFSALNSLDGYLLCDGAAVSRTTYAALFAVISTSFGAGNGSSTFNLPDFRGRLFGAVGTGSGLTARGAGASIGAETHTLTIAQMPSHDHYQYNTYAGTNNQNTYPSPSYNDYNNNTAVPSKSQSSSTGGGQAHNIVQPTAFGGNVFIKY